MSDVILRIEASVAAGIAGIRGFKDEVKATQVATADLRTTYKATTADIAELARKQIAVEAEKVAAYREQIAVQKEVTASYRRGSDERMLSARAEIDLQRRLQATLGETAIAAGRAGKASSRGAEESGLLRGAASRSGVAGTGMAALAGPGFIAGAIVGGTVDYAVKQAIQEQKAQANLVNALKDTGNARKSVERQTNEYLKAEEHLTGFTRDQVTQTLSQLIRSTGDLTKARKDESIMADIARARQTDLNGAMMLVLKASMGNVGALRRLGIDVAKVTTNTDALKEAHLGSNRALAEHAKALDLAATKQEVMAAVTQKFAGAGAAYMHTFGGESAKLTNVLHDLFVELGTKAIPVLTRLFEWITKEIDAVRRSTTAHKALHDTIEILKTMWDGAVEIVRLFSDVMHDKFLRVIPLAVGAVWLLNAALDANPFIAVASAAVLAVGLIYRHWNAIAGFFRKLWEDVKAIFFLAWDELKIEAVDAVLAIIEPFSHLPGGMGKWARQMKDGLHTQLDAMRRDAADQGAIIGGEAGRKMYEAFLPFTTQIAAAASGAFGAAGGAIGAGAGAGAGAAGKTGVGGGNFQQGNIVRSARSQLGVAYAFGGAAILGHPTDCAGLAQAVLAQNGIHVGRTSEQQWTQGTAVKWGDLQPGDLVFFDTHDSQSPPSHVGIYIGGGQFIEDPHTGASVRVTSLSDPYYSKNYMGARRYVKTTTTATHGAGSGDPSEHSGLPKTTAADAAFQKQIAAASAAAAAAKAAKAGLKAPSLIGLEGAITAELKAVPGQTDAVEQEAIAHIKRIRDSLHVGMSQTELAKDRVDLARWGKVLKDEIAKNAKEAAKTAREQAAELKKAAAAVKAAWLSEWTVDTAAIARSISESWQAVQKQFDRETAAGLQTMQRDAAAGLQKLQRDFAAQMLQFDRATQAGLQGLVVAQTPEEKALADFEAQRAASDAATAAAQRSSDLATQQAALAAMQQAGVGGTDASGNVVTQQMIDQQVQAVSGAVDAINQAALDATDAGLKAAADASRIAQNKKTEADQQAYADQRDALKQALGDQETVLEQSYSDKATLAQQAYTDQRGAQWQALQNLHDDQVTQFDADLKLWGTWLSTKQRSWADFLTWLQQNPVSKGFTGESITDPNVAAARANLQAQAIVASKGGDEAIAAALRARATAHYAGGIHMRPTLGMLGDQGAEATLPLTGQRGQAVVEQLARAIAQAGGGGGGTTIYGTFLGATERQVGRALESLVTPQQSRVVRYKAPI